MEPAEIKACKKWRDPKSKAVTVLAVGVIFLMVLVIVASTLNRADYYLKSANGAIEIWRGRFSPMGKERILILPGAQPPPSDKNVYSENEINVIVFNYYIDRADMLLEDAGMPDFSGIKLYLKMALAYGVSDDMRQAAYNRLNTIDMMIYLYKADVAASKGNLAGFQTALEHMGKAAELKLNPAQSKLVKMRIQSIHELMATIENKNTAPPGAPVRTLPDRQNPQPNPNPPVK